MKKLLKHKKALSPVVAAIILIAVTVAVSIAVAAWMGALTIGFMGTEELRVLGVEFVTGGADMVISVRNTGTTKIVIAEVKAGSQSISNPTVTSTTGTGNELPAGETGTIATGFSWTSGTTYEVEVITGKGNIFPYRAYAPD